MTLQGRRVGPGNQLLSQFSVLLNDLDVLGLGTLRVFDDIELDDLTLSKASETRRVDGGMVDENVLATVIALDESETLLIVEPLHLARGHASDSLKSRPDPENKKTPGARTKHQGLCKLRGELH
jgi:hypothetical protein